MKLPTANLFDVLVRYGCRVTCNLNYMWIPCLNLGNTEEAAEQFNALYRQIIDGGGF